MLSTIMLTSNYRSIWKFQKNVTLSCAKFPQLAIIKRFKFDKRETDLWKKTNIDKALKYFDDFYGSFYGNLWPPTRLAMLSTPKHCALVNYYGDYESTIETLKNMGCIDISEIFEEHRSKKLKRRKFHSNKSSEIDKETVEETMEECGDVNSVDRVVTPGQASSALLNYVPTSKLKGMEDWVEEEDQLKYVDPTCEFAVAKERDERLHFPPLLKAFVFPRGEVSRFPRPKQSSLGTLNYYLMDAASLLPVLAMNLQPTESVLDMCAAPGGKSLAMLQTVYPNILVCNDVSKSRIFRLKNVFKQYLGQTQSWKGHLDIRMSDALQWSQFNSFDKVLVDVPCTNDRHTVMEEDNNFFNAYRLKERISLPETQSALLSAGIQACKPGGTVVYSTCSLSPIQNDGVVHMAIKQLKETRKIEVVVQDMSMTVKNLEFLCRFAPSAMLRYGQVVLPSIVNNFGPMYISKLKRVK